MKTNSNFPAKLEFASGQSAIGTVRRKIESNNKTKRKRIKAWVRFIKRMNNNSRSVFNEIRNKDKTVLIPWKIGTGKS